MPDDMKPRVVRVPEEAWDNLAIGSHASVCPDLDRLSFPRALLVPLGDLPAPGEMGETKYGKRSPCLFVEAHIDGAVVSRYYGTESLTRRVDPEPTVEEALERLEDFVDAFHHYPKELEAGARADLARIRAHITGETDG